jgi:DNA-binding response OmpR family regulator
MSSAAVLVVGDDPALRAAIRLNLESEGVAVYETSASGDAWEPPATVSPAVCILDLHVPTPHEWTKLPAVRRWSALRDVPVLVVADEPPDPALGEEHRPDAHLIKPFHAEDLVRNVQRMLRSGAKFKVPSSKFKVQRAP